MRKFIVINVPDQPKKSSLQLKVERLIKKCDKQNYKFNELQLSIFNALGRAKWDEDKVNWLALEQFEKLYSRFYPHK